MSRRRWLRYNRRGRARSAFGAIPADHCPVGCGVPQQSRGGYWTPTTVHTTASTRVSRIVETVVTVEAVTDYIPIVSMSSKSRLT